MEWEERPPLADAAAALTSPPLFSELRDNLAFARSLDVGGADAVFADPDAITVSDTFITGRHTGVTLEPRSILADFRDETLTVWMSHQAPQMMTEIFAQHFALAETQVRVICRDVGGSFGGKVHTYPDEMAAVACALLLRRPVSFLAYWLESFLTDIHARDHVVEARLAVHPDGTLRALEIDDLTGIGPYSVYPRTSAVEGNQVVNLTGSWYRLPAFKARLRVALQTKVPTCQYRGVGHPVAVAVTEGLMDLAAARLGQDPAEIRRRNLLTAYPHTALSGLRFENLSLLAAFKKLLVLMEYDRLRAEQAEARADGKLRGIGLACFVELSNPGPAFYGVGGAPISAQDGCTIRLDPGGTVTASISVTKQGQGTEAMIAQVVAHTLSVSLD